MKSEQDLKILNIFYIKKTAINNGDFVVMII
jgi:hypothetical protein